MIHVTEDIVVNEQDITEKFSRGFGPGGKTDPRRNTAVRASIDLGKIQISDRAADRLMALAGRHVTTDGMLVVEARAGSSQEENRQAAQSRLLKLLQRAGEEPRARMPTRPRRSVRNARKAEKQQHGAIKRARRKAEE